MVNVVIVEDEPNEAKLLRNYLDGITARRGEKFSVSVYGDAETFLVNYRHDTDIVFMDIELPDMNGMEAARKLRERDGLVMLVFVTNMANFAVKGYSVGAFDFLVKPVTFFDFFTLMERAMPVIGEKKESETVVRTPYGFRQIKLSNIGYIEVVGHRVIYHLSDGVIEGWGSLSDLEQKLGPSGFARCNNAYLVNMKHVTAVESNEICVLGNRLAVSRTKKKEFLRRLNEYLGER